MSLISNSCVTGYLYKDYFKIPFQNPFIWSYIDINSFINLMINYQTLNYNNIKMENTNHIIIDGLVDVHYLHYVKDSTYNVPTYIKSDNTIRYKNIEDYVIDKYKSRLKRMSVNEEPIFIIAHSYKYLTIKDLQLLANTNLIYQCLVYNDVSIVHANPRLKIFHSNIKNNNKKLSDYIFSHMSSIIHSNGILS